MLRQPFVRSYCAGLLVGTLAWLGSPTGQLGAESPEFNPRVVIRRAMPAIQDAPVISAEQADRQLQDAELVLGIRVNGKERAYPINMLTGPQREIINDTLGGRAIAATW